MVPLGSFTDSLICRLFDCGKHHCSKPCHPPSLFPPHCPRSPSQVTHCPCGKYPLDPSSAESFSPGANLFRVSCSEPIPTCTSTCMRSLKGCSHVCSFPCHVGDCPPCSIMLVRPCRCGTTTKDIRCSDFKSSSQSEILCDRSCAALRACGRHQCNRLCCPLASLAGVAKTKGKKRAVGAGLLDGIGMDEAGLHECDLVCGKMLGCGNHRCEERDHRGACPPCLQSSFEEVRDNTTHCLRPWPNQLML
jgi:transcriptional repressor NF-X1